MAEKQEKVPSAEDNSAQSNSSSDFKAVFLSHCVRSTGEQANRLYDLLKQNEISAFICGRMEVGDDFRTDINGNAANCKAMVVFLDEAWAQSGECEAEFFSAISLYNRKKTPKILPIVVDGFHWIDPEQHSEAHNITSRFQCLTIQRGSETDEVFEKIIEKCRELVFRQKSLSEQKKKTKSEVTEQTNNLIESFITCEICHNMFTDPRMLPCNHTFCLGCLKSWKETLHSKALEFLCPKCKTKCDQKNVDQLPVDFKANQLIEVFHGSKVNDSKLLKADSSAKPNNLNISSELEKWFADHKIPAEAHKVLIDEGFETLEVILDLTKEDLNGLSAMKQGHRAMILKAIEHSKPNFESLLKSEEMKMIESVSDDRILTSGTHPNDSLKFWATFDEKQLEETANQYKNLAQKLLEAETSSTDLKTDKLYKIAMVLCETGQYADAERIARSSLSLLGGSSTNAECEMYLKTNMLMLFAMLNRIRIGITFVQKDKNDITDLYKSHLEQCEQLLKKGDKKLDDKMKLKLTGMLMFSVRSVKARQSDFTYDVKSLLSSVAKLSKKVSDKGLQAEVLMNEVLLDNMSKKPSIENRIKKLIEARKICAANYGEYTTLMSRISHNLGVEFEKMKKDELAYECYRRTWLIEMQLYGTHHPETVKSGSIIADTDYFKEIAVRNKDTLPGDLKMGTPDLNYEMRLKAVYDYKPGK
ncbi:uncharacterized protein LOC142335895 isoform X2 [Convolutriloba macropyga]|uniref:uncharacterized protein LOC142335895 isoform X2 n=1 Tax=Convolutriloba macropyga TaxID=536237 RepID=UPI003F51E95F